MLLYRSNSVSACISSPTCAKYSMRKPASRALLTALASRSMTERRRSTDPCTFDYYCCIEDRLTNCCNVFQNTHVIPSSIHACVPKWSSRLRIYAAGIPVRSETAVTRGTAPSSGPAILAISELPSRSASSSAIYLKNSGFISKINTLSTSFRMLASSQPTQPPSSESTVKISSSGKIQAS